MRFTTNVTALWSLMPGVVCVLVMMEGLEVSMRSRMLPDSMRVGSFTIFCNPNSLIISSSLLFASCSGVCRLLVIPVYVR